MPILSIPSATQSPAASTASQTSASLNLGQDEFLRLFVTKLANQDPLSPMEDENFIAQLAQFTQLEQLTQMNDLLSESLEKNTLMTQSISNMMVPALIGRTIRAESNSAILGDTGDAAFRFDLASAAENVLVEISDSGGSLVRVLALNGRPAGSTEATWDGKDTSGQRLPAGSYQINVRATDSEGESVASQSYFSGTVDGIRYVDGAAFLAVGDALVPLTSVIEVLSDKE